MVMGDVSSQNSFNHGFFKTVPICHSVDFISVDAMLKKVSS